MQSVVGWRPRVIIVHGLGNYRCHNSYQIVPATFPSSSCLSNPAFELAWNSKLFCFVKRYDAVIKMSKQAYGVVFHLFLDQRRYPFTDWSQWAKPNLPSGPDHMSYEVLCGWRMVVTVSRRVCEGRLQVWQSASLRCILIVANLRFIVPHSEIFRCWAPLRDILRQLD